MVTLKVADILAESVVDGLGIRTVVFFKAAHAIAQVVIMHL